MLPALISDKVKAAGYEGGPQMHEHAEFMQGLERVRRFVNEMRLHNVAAPASDKPLGADGGPGLHHDRALPHIANVLEDIPEDLHHLTKMLLLRPVDDDTRRPEIHQAVLDVLHNVGGDVLGQIERVTEQLSKIHILAGLMHHTPYTYVVDDKLTRGARPTADKLAQLHAAGATCSINLCEEMEHGDKDLASGTGLETVHVKIVDNTAPSLGQIDDVLRVIQASSHSYIHCEAGIGRTGVMVACYRISSGWSPGDALQEARNFGCTMPDQIGTIQIFAQKSGVLPSFRVTGDQMHQTVALNTDPIGLSRAIGILSGVFGQR